MVRNFLSLQTVIKTCKLPSAILFIVKKGIRYSHTLKLNGILLNNVRQKELYWYHKLKTYAVFGISEHEDSRR